jgi:hypothetical protein
MKNTVKPLLPWVFLLSVIGLIYAEEAKLQDSYIETDGTGLTITSVPSKAKVYIDGIQRGITPLSLPNLVTGKYQIKLVKEGYATRTVLVTLLEGKHLDLTLVLAQATGRLIINLDRSPAAPGPERLPLRAELYVDDAHIDRTYLTLPIGWHRIRVEAFGWEPIEKNVLVLQDFTQTLTVRMEPARFTVNGFHSERLRLNPHNPGMLGATDIIFQVNAAGTGTITIYDSQNYPVYEYQFRPFAERNQRLTWNGTDMQGNTVSDGLYKIVLTTTSLPYDTSDPIHIDEQISILIDSSLVIRPWSIGSGGAGLVYLAIPETLAPLSFQIDSRLAFGHPYGADAVFTSVPFSIGLRFAPADSWELALSGEFDSSRDPSANQFSFALRKKVLSAKHNMPLSIGIDVSYTLADVSSRTDPAVISWSGSQGGPRVGCSMLIPMGEHVGIGIGPALVWPMAIDFRTTASIPDIELGTGIIGTGETITGGVSAKVLWQPTEGNRVDWGMPLTMTAAELHWFPKPSVLVFHLAGGLWQFQQKNGVFGSIGLGIIH